MNPSIILSKRHFFVRVAAGIPASHFRFHALPLHSHRPSKEPGERGNEALIPTEGLKLKTPQVTSFSAVHCQLSMATSPHFQRNRRLFNDSSGTTNASGRPDKPPQGDSASRVRLPKAHDQSRIRWSESAVRAERIPALVSLGSRSFQPIPIHHCVGQ